MSVKFWVRPHVLRNPSKVISEGIGIQVAIARMVRVYWATFRYIGVRLDFYTYNGFKSKLFCFKIE